MNKDDVFDGRSAGRLAGGRLRLDGEVGCRRWQTHPRPVKAQPEGNSYYRPQSAFKYRICYTCAVPDDEWDIYQTDEVAVWMEDLRRDDPGAAEKVEAAVDVLSEHGPTLGRPLVDTLTGSKIANLKELRPRQTTIRVLFVFDPWRSAILLVAGDKAGQWKTWYNHAIPRAEELYAVYLKERAKEEEEEAEQGQ